MKAMSNPRRIRTLRHWKQRFDKNAKFIWRKTLTWEGVPTVLGELIPVSMEENKNKLRRFWEAGAIELAEFEAPDVLTGRKAEKAEKAEEPEKPKAEEPEKPKAEEPEKPKAEEPKKAEPVKPAAASASPAVNDKPKAATKPGGAPREPGKAPDASPLDE
jgi:hypothetical protein